MYKIPNRQRSLNTIVLYVPESLFIASKTSAPHNLVVTIKKPEKRVHFHNRFNYI